MYSCRMVREGLSDEVTSKQRPEECGGANQVCTWENRLLSKGSEKHEACVSEEKCGWNRLSRGQGQALLEVQREGIGFPSETASGGMVKRNDRVICQGFYF